VAGLQEIPAARPDTNILDWAAKEDGSSSLDTMNRLNQKIYEECSYYSGQLYEKKFLTSKTVFTRKEYGEVPAIFLKGLGLEMKDWEKKGEVMILRSTVMTPFLDGDEAFESWWNTFMDSIREVLETATVQAETKS